MKEVRPKVGRLKWKSPTEYRSFIYGQSGFELKNTSGWTATLRLSKIGEIQIRYHHELGDVYESGALVSQSESPGDSADGVTIKEVHIEKERTGECSPRSSWTTANRHPNHPPNRSGASALTWVF